VPEYGQRPSRAIFMGRLASEKSVDELLQAWSLSSAGASGWALEIYGDGPERGKLIQLAHQLDVADSVTFPGTTSLATDVLANAQVHLSTSHREGMPMSILEANSVGTPSIVYDASPGTREVVQDGRSGILVQVGDVKAFARELAMFLSSAARRKEMSRAAREYAKAFVPEAVDERWRKVLAPGRASVSARAVQASTSDAVVFEGWFLRATRRASITIVTVVDQEIEAKSLVITVDALDSQGSVLPRESVRLPWSSLLQAPYANFPHKPSGISEVSIPVPVSDEVGGLRVRIQRWGLKKHRPSTVVRGVYLFGVAQSDGLVEVGVKMLPVKGGSDS